MTSQIGLPKKLYILLTPVVIFDEMFSLFAIQKKKVSERLNYF